MKFWKDFYIHNRFYYLVIVVVCLLAGSYFHQAIFVFAQIGLIAIVLLFIVDYIMLFKSSEVLKIARRLPENLSLGDKNTYFLDIENVSGKKLNVEIIDELPFQLQERDFQVTMELGTGNVENIACEIVPKLRGLYEFGNVNVFCSSRLSLVVRRCSFDRKETIKVLPSIIHMKKVELLAIKQSSLFQGVKKIRRIGTSFEFERIRQYIPGDDYRHINWKATGRSQGLMVNQYEDEKSQPIYSIIDNSRSMLMPFNNLSLLDHAVNTSLAISNICLKKEDKAGLLTFSKGVNTFLKASNDPSQLRRLVNGLYNEKETNDEANYELLYIYVREAIKNRSLLFLYSNFESEYALDRVISILQKINALHLLVMIFFENEEVAALSKEKADNLEQVYQSTLASKFVSEKKLMVQKLNKRGIQTIYTAPKNLSISTVNKYLELKSRGLI